MPVPHPCDHHPCDQLQALEREKSELESIKMKLREGDKPETAVATATGNDEHPLKDVVKQNSKLEALKRKLTRMTDSLAAEIEKVGSRSFVVAGCEYSAG